MPCKKSLAAPRARRGAGAVRDSRHTAVRGSGIVVLLVVRSQRTSLSLNVLTVLVVVVVVQTTHSKKVRKACCKSW